MQTLLLLSILYVSSSQSALLEMPSACMLQIGARNTRSTAPEMPEVPQYDFSTYLTNFGRNLVEGSPEFIQRQALFQRRVDSIVAQNGQPNRRWTAAVNAFTDRTEEELAQVKGWRHVHGSSHGGGAVLLAESTKIIRTTPAATVNWRNLSMADTVLDQGGCGSCWAVATKTMLDGRHEAQRAQSRSFSAQQLVNCVPNPKECGGQGGCQGATVELAMAYIEEMGLEEETAVPYLASDGTCQHPLPLPSLLQHQHQSHKGGSRIGLQSWHKLAENRALPLMLAAMDGPVAVSVAASQWFGYSDGVFDGCEKDSVIDHAVVLFGYGGEVNSKYWMIRNSWGHSWGEGGFIRLLRHDTPEEDEGFCGSDTDPAAGLACKPYPDSVTICGMCGILYDSVVANFA